LCFRCDNGISDLWLTSQHGHFVKDHDNCFDQHFFGNVFGNVDWDIVNIDERYPNDYKRCLLDIAGFGRSRNTD
jgi:hypothetical protein